MLVLSIAGDQVPVSPLFEVVGSVNTVPEHIGPGLVKVGVIELSITTVIVSVDTHPELSGVNVYVVVVVLSVAGDQIPVARADLNLIQNSEKKCIIEASFKAVAYICISRLFIISLI